MPKKKAEPDPGIESRNIPDLYESWLAKQPVKRVRAKPGFVSAKERQS